MSKADEIPYGTEELVVRPSADDIRKFTEVVRDPHPIHRYIEAANKAGHEKLVIPGTLISAYFERFMLSKGIEYPLNSLMTFNSFAYEGYSLILRRNPEKKDGLELICLNQDEKLLSTFRERSDKLKEPEKGDCREYFNFRITEELVESYCQVSGIDSTEIIGKSQTPFSILTSTVLSAILQFMFGESGAYEGIYKKLNFDFRRPPKTGDLRVNLYLTKRRGNPESGFVYSIWTDCFQNGVNVLSSNAMVASKVDII